MHSHSFVQFNHYILGYSITLLSHRDEIKSLGKVEQVPLIVHEYINQTVLHTQFSFQFLVISLRMFILLNIYDKSISKDVTTQYVQSKIYNTVIRDTPTTSEISYQMALWVRYVHSSSYNILETYYCISDCITSYTWYFKDLFIAQVIYPWNVKEIITIILYTGMY